MEKRQEFQAPREYYELWESSIKSPDVFWGRLAESSSGDIRWFRKWDSVLEKRPSGFRWFAGGKTNIGYNCVDYKVPRYRDKAAYIQEVPELGISRRITYGELFAAVTRYAAALRNLGISKGDRVLLYLPNSIEAVVMLHACARVGAISTCVFAGFSPGALADRIALTRPGAILTQDFTVRRGKEVPLKQSVDEALKLCPREVAEGVEFIITNPVAGRNPSVASQKDISLPEFEERGRGGDGGYLEMEANEPLFIMCTSGTTAKPKPVVHVHGGFQIWSYWTAKWVYAIKPEDVIFNTSDIGWIVGQSYLVFGPLLAGATAILYEGVLDYPQPDMWWQTMEKHRATMLWTAPTGARTLRGLGVDLAARHDLSSIERVVVAGEVLNPEVWSWLYRDVFKGSIPVFDHMWQTEVPGAIFGYPYGVKMPEVRPGSAGLPMPGVLPEIVNEYTGQPCGIDEKGMLLLREPVPGMAQTLWQDPERYRREYWEAMPVTMGRYFTGDSAYRDKDGYIWFCGRSDEVIKISGHRIGPAEVESALVAHPAVHEAAVCGVPDEMRGQVVAAFVVLKAGMQSSDALKQAIIESVKNLLGPIIVFRGIEFVNILPKTRSGKIMRRVMRKLWLGEPLGDMSAIETEASVSEIREAVAKLVISKDDG